MGITVLNDDTKAYKHSIAELKAYAEFLGVDLEKEPHMEWIVREGLLAPVPHPWVACTENSEEIFYFNFVTGESVWDHPSDAKYRCMVEEYRQKHKATTKEARPMTASTVAHANTITPCFLPSRAMESMLDEMWACGLRSDQDEFKEIQNKVEATCNMRARLCHVPAIYPGFKDELLPYVDVTQEDIDGAWLDAAIDIRGRPAVRLSSSSLFLGDCSCGVERGSFHADTERAWEMTPDEGQRTSSMIFDGRGSFPPSSTVDFESSFWLPENVDVSYEAAQADERFLLRSELDVQFDGDVSARPFTFTHRFIPGTPTSLP